MGWYRRSKFTFDAFRYFTSKIIPRENALQSSAVKTHLNGCSSRIPTVNKSRAYGFGLSGPTVRTPASRNQSGLAAQILRNSGSRLGLRQDTGYPFPGVGRRYYYVDRYQVRHFKPRGYKNWFQNPRNVFAVVLVCSGVVITVYFGHLEAVPYTKRTHFVLLSRNVERKLGETQFEEMKKSFKGKILPPIHPESVRVRLIAKDLIEALQRGLKKEQIWRDRGYASELHVDEHGDGHATLMALSEDPPSMEGKWNKEDEILDDKWVQQSRKKGIEKGKEPATQHLEGLNWEVLVVHEPVVNAFCLPGGKIVVFTGLLNHFRTDAEIATILGHEVAHAVARHAAEGITKNLWFAIMQLILYQFVMPDLVNTMSNLFLRLPFSRK
ncbi:OLC1v1027283C1 [Oldenlandia corymbosa var. corymbosa]|nr:OLC1v1027283C1 [Oldenlandia corymbosa var. corymbosa]